MRMLTWIVIALLAVTKLADALTTITRLRHIGEESNPLARRLMHQLGARGAVWFITALAFGIIALAGAIALNGGLLFQPVFIAAGILVALIQAAAAHANWTRRDNMVTASMRTLLAQVGRLIRLQ